MKRQVIQFKMSRYLTSYFSKDGQKASVHMKRYPTLVKVIKIKTRIIYHFTFNRMIIMRQCSSNFYVPLQLGQ